MPADLHMHQVPCAHLCSVIADRWTSLPPGHTRAHTQVALGILRRSGVINVVTAEDGVQALEVIDAQGHLGPDAFDLILMDLHMPRMVSGSWGSLPGPTWFLT